MLVVFLPSLTAKIVIPTERGKGGGHYEYVALGGILIGTNKYIEGQADPGGCHIL